MHLKKVSKKIILITGGKGVLGSYFYNKYKTKYKIISFPYRLEQINKLQEWFKKKKFQNFIHFAAITSQRKKNYNKIHLINKILPIKIIKLLQKSLKKEFRYFLFISTSHVYGFHKKKISEYDKRKPFNKYGRTKKAVEDFILNRKNKFYFKIGIARIFNFTSDKQNKGHFIPDVYAKIKNKENLINFNKNRDFIHIDDVAQSLELMIRKRKDKALNICSGNKINLVSLTRKLNFISLNKKLIFINSRKKINQDIYGNNSLLKKLGMKKFKNLNIILNSFLYGKKANINNR